MPIFLKITQTIILLKGKLKCRFILTYWYDENAIGDLHVCPNHGSDQVYVDKSREPKS